ncbi:MAG: hypothetical protein FJ030_05255 [Chloroflexi bacterium]|nr:hypothetical protein [Chloroflexota bacterium]
MRFFRSEEDLQQWQSERGKAEGETLRPEQVWELSRLWYHNRLSPDYRGRTVAQVEEIFHALNLTSKFWYMDKPTDELQK